MALHEDGSAVWRAGSRLAHVLPRHRLITLSLVLYVFADKVSWFTKSWTNVCEVRGTSKDHMVSTLDAVFDPDLWDKQSPVARTAPIAGQQVAALGASSPLHSASSVAPLLHAASPSSSSAHLRSLTATASPTEGHPRSPENALFFLIASLLIGCCVSHSLTSPCLQGLQQTVILFIAGVLCALAIDPLQTYFGPVGESYAMWMEIDPRLLLFTLLPPLVTGDAMTIDTSVAKRVAQQCFYLAGPGVAINGFMIACFLYVYLPYDWPFLLCLCTGSILCATDPVVVVHLLRELGASSTLTVQIEGESLLNDGTAIVMYTIAYKMLCGAVFDFGDIIQFLVKMALYAWALGIGIGFFFYLMIKMTNDKFHDNNKTIQVVLVLCCAYSSFILAEGYFEISGVLATVAAALVLAHKMWPQVVCKQSMHTVWHMFEYLGNTIIFFLAGALTGKTMMRITFQDYIHLFVIYLATTFLRGILLFGSMPVLERLGADNQVSLSAADLLVMTWGGLRGAVALALAIQVQVDKGEGKVSTLNADRVLFYVSGIASLTLVVNATTCGAMVKWMGITQLPSAKKKMLQALNRQLVLKVEKANEGKAECRITNRMKEEMIETLVEIEEVVTGEDASEMSLSRCIKELDPQTHVLVEDLDSDEEAKNIFNQDTVIVRVRAADKRGFNVVEMMSPNVLRANLQEAKYRIGCFDLQALKKLEDLPPLVLLDQEDAMLDLAVDYVTNPPMQRAINEAFVALLRRSYWEMLDESSFTDSRGCETLLATLTLEDRNSFDLTDWTYLKDVLQGDFSGSMHKADIVDIAHTMSSQKAKVKDPGIDCLKSVILSLAFQFFIALAIVANFVVINVESAVKGENESRGQEWLTTELAFNAVFTLEFLLKFSALWWRYFQDSWNCFDFLLVVFGIAGSAIGFLADELSDSSAGMPGSEARLIRVAQIFRMMRIVRLFRLVRFWSIIMQKIFHTKVDRVQASFMRKSLLLMNFIRGHVRSQELMVEYFGHLGRVNSVELSRCILQSQLFVYEAIILDEEFKRQLRPEILDEVQTAKKCSEISKKLEEFIMDVTGSGVISNRLAQELLRPIDAHVMEFLATVGGLANGKVVDLCQLDGTASASLTASNFLPVPGIDDKQGTFDEPKCPLVVRQLIGFEFGQLPDPDGPGEKDAVRAEESPRIARQGRKSNVSRLERTTVADVVDEAMQGKESYQNLICAPKVQKPRLSFSPDGISPSSLGIGRKSNAGSKNAREKSITFRAHDSYQDSPELDDRLRSADARTGSPPPRQGGLAGNGTHPASKALPVQELSEEADDKASKARPRSPSPTGGFGFGFEPAQEPAPEALSPTEGSKAQDSSSGFEAFILPQQKAPAPEVPSVEPAPQAPSVDGGKARDSSSGFEAFLVPQQKPKRIATRRKVKKVAITGLSDDEDGAVELPKVKAAVPSCSGPSPHLPKVGKGSGKERPAKVPLISSGSQQEMPATLTVYSSHGSLDEPDLAAGGSSSSSRGNPPIASRGSILAGQARSTDGPPSQPVSSTPPEVKRKRMVKKKVAVPALPRPSGFE